MPRRHVSIFRPDFMMTSGLPFDDISALIRQMPAGTDEAAERTRAARYCEGEKSDRLGEMAIWLSRCSGKPPTIRKPLVAIFAGTQGVEAHGISNRGRDSTLAQVEACSAGVAPLNRICAEYDLGLQVYDLALDLPTGDLTSEVSLDEKSCAVTMAFGMEAVAGGIDLLCVGAFGAGNDVVAAAILAALHGGTGRDWLAPLDDSLLLERQIDAVDGALAFHKGSLGAPLEVLRRFGGRQFAAIAGAVIAARTQKVPVVLDGAAAIASAAILKAIRPDAVDHCMLAQRPDGDRFRKAAADLGCLAAFEITMSEDDGVAAALVAGLLKGAATLAPVGKPASPLR